MFDFDIRNILLMVVPVIMALTVHEYAHALAAYRLGDNTAKNEGRLTLNPLAHLDPLGTIMLFFSKLIGWAKPVPFNPGNFKNPVRDTTLVALAGPVSNFMLAILISIILKVFTLLNVFSLIPGVGADLRLILMLGVLVNISLGVFNLLPIPPLDGFKVLSYFLPYKWVVQAYKYQMFFMIFFIILVIAGVLPALVRPIVFTLFSFLG